MKLLIVSGISGSGKTTFMRALEDIGYFCVDHFPLILLQRFSELSRLAENKIEKCALVIDIREKEFFDLLQFITILRPLDGLAIKLQCVFGFCLSCLQL